VAQILTQLRHAIGQTLADQIQNAIHKIVLPVHCRLPCFWCASVYHDPFCLSAHQKVAASKPGMPFFGAI
jgi:hypothetical protein